MPCYSHLASVIEHLLGLKIIPAMLNNLLQVLMSDDAGIDKLF